MRKLKEVKRPINYWQQIENRKDFFLKFAADNGFDPYIASNWASRKKQLLAYKNGALSILKRYNGNLRRALKDTFSNLTFKGL